MSLILSVLLTSRGFNLAFVDLTLFVQNAERIGRISKLFWKAFKLATLYPYGQVLSAQKAKRETVQLDICRVQGV